MTRSVRSPLWVWFGFLLAVCCVAFAPAAHATEPPQAASVTRTASAEPSGPPPEWQLGPRSVKLEHEIELSLPAGYVYLPPAEAKKTLEKNGSFHNDAVLGLLASDKPNEEWFAVVQYEDSGYVKDDEKLDGDEILSTLRDGVKEANEERQQRGFKPLSLDGWSEAPRYDAARHHMVWALIVSDPDGKSVNYNTRILGRRGYVSLNLVTSPESLPAYKGNAATLLTAMNFEKGARYEDFDKKTDKVAEYGLAGLVLAGAGVGAAKLVKIGLLAKFGKLIIAALIAGKKAIVIAVLAIGAAVKKFFFKSDAESSAPKA